MGASLAQTIHTRQPHLTLLTSITGRSQSTIDRATSAGLTNVSLDQLVAKADIIISISSPSAALTLATDIINVLSSRNGPPPIYVDANAVSPGTMSELAKILEPREIPLIDGGVIGDPARQGHDPTIYRSSSSKYTTQMKMVTEVLSGGERGKGLKVDVLEITGEGAASALKCFMVESTRVIRG